MHGAYLKPCQISKMMRHIENSSIVRTVYSGIFRHIQGHSAILSHVQGYWGTLRHIQALLRCTESYSNMFRTLCNPCIYSRVIFITLTHFEPDVTSKVCQTCKMTRHIQKPGIVRTLCTAQKMKFSIKDFFRRGRPPLPFFENLTKCSTFRKKGTDCLYLWVNFPKKTFKM